jgi:hypothetical protein
VLKTIKLAPFSEQDRHQVWHSVIDECPGIKNKKKWKNKKRLIKKFIKNYQRYCSRYQLELMYDIN